MGRKKIYPRILLLRPFVGTYNHSQVMNENVQVGIAKQGILLLFTDVEFDYAHTKLFCLRY